MYTHRINKLREWIQTDPSCEGLRDALDVPTDRTGKALCHVVAGFAKDLTIGGWQSYHLALVWHFSANHGCSRDPSLAWEWDPATQQGVGNPAYDPEYRQAVKEHNARVYRPDERRTQPCRYPALKELIASIDERLNEIITSQRNGARIVSKERTQLEMARCYAVMSYRLWTRLRDLCQLRWEEIGATVDVDQDGHPYIWVRLPFRDKNLYNLYNLPGRKFSDVVDVIPRWRQYWTMAAGVAPEPEDLVFPNWGPNGQLEITTEIQGRGVNNMLGAGIKLTSDPKNFPALGTLAFKRGGSQDEYVYAEEYGGRCLTLEQVRWWGGFAGNDREFTQLKRLFDSGGIQDSRSDDEDGGSPQPAGAREASPHDESFQSVASFAEPVQQSHTNQRREADTDVAPRPNSRAERSLLQDALQQGALSTTSATSDAASRRAHRSRHSITDSHSKENMNGMAVNPQNAASGVPALSTNAALRNSRLNGAAAAQGAPRKSDAAAYRDAFPTDNGAALGTPRRFAENAISMAHREAHAGGSSGNSSVLASLGPRTESSEVKALTKELGETRRELSDVRYELAKLSSRFQSELVEIRTSLERKLEDARKEVNVMRNEQQLMLERIFSLLQQPPH